MRSFTFLIFTLILSGCYTSGAPECSNEQVKGLLHQLMVKQLKDFIAPESSGIAFAKYATVNEKVRNKIDALIPQLTIAIENIRTQQRDNDIRKTLCSADVAILTESKQYELARVANTTTGITYSAQFDDEGNNIIVERLQ